MKYLISEAIIKNLLEIAYHDGKMSGLLNKEYSPDEFDKSLIFSILDCYKIEDDSEVEV